MRIPHKPSTAKCTLSMYIAFLLSEPKSANCQRLSEVIEISHDSANRFLLRENYTPADLFNEVKPHIRLENGSLSVDDTVIDKPYANLEKWDLLGWFWSGKHKRPVKGLNLITLYYTDPAGKQVPVNYRIYNKSEGKTKNDYFLEMLDEVIAWGLRPAWVPGDSWYSALNNLTAIRNYAIGFMFAIENNRLVAIEGGKSCQVRTMEIPENGQSAYLKGFGEVVIFRTIFKNEYRYYVMFKAKQEDCKRLILSDFISVHDCHWNIERYHRTVKQVCNIESFQVRTSICIQNHIFSALAAFVQLEFMRTEEHIDNWYRLRRDLFNEVMSKFIQSREIPDGVPFITPLLTSVNA